MRVTDIIKRYNSEVSVMEFLFGAAMVAFLIYLAVRQLRD